MSSKRPVQVLAVFGTRPEAIKMGPVVRLLRQYPDEIQTHVVVTGQHRSMLDQVLRVFEIVPDGDLDIMSHNQTLTDITVRALRGLEDTLSQDDYHLVMVQGDTTTAFAGALAGFYQKIPVAHIEAGLRTRNKYNPYPEEANRHFIDVIADLCFAPTEVAEQALLEEHVDPDRILVTGNTVIDALLATVQRDYVFQNSHLHAIDSDPNRHTLLVTAHRRENHGKPLQHICAALRQLLETRSDLRLVIPVHLNPNVYDTVHGMLGDLEHAHLVDPLDYVDFVNLMAQAHIVLTDSGGVQEEAPSLGKPVLVMRETTERPEAISAGTARLVGTAQHRIIEEVTRLLDDPTAYHRMAQAVNPYGDGQAAQRSVQAIRHYFGLVDTKPTAFEMTPAAQQSN